MVDSKHQWKAWLYLSPAIVLLLIFTVWPIINTVRIAFLEGYNALEALYGIEFNVGFGNFIKVLQYSDFMTCLKNTLWLTVLTVPISTVLALLIAVALNSIKPLQKFLQTVFFLPYVTNSIAIGMVFAAMFNIIGLSPDGARAESWGIINNVLMFFGADPINWINAQSSYAANIAVMVIYIVWNALPFKILILLGGLQSINKQYYDAARVDGTPRWRVLWRITVPLLSPMLAYVIITSFIGGFKEYSSIVGIFGEKMGPVGADLKLNTMVGYIYEALPEMNYGIASAAALILFAIILVVTMINLWVSKKRVHF
jgi:multiple sugar transport system permease protein